MSTQLETGDITLHSGPGEYNHPYRSQDKQEFSPESALREQVEKLNQIGIALSGQTHLEKLLELIVHEARAFTSADAGSLYILEHDMLYFHVAQNDTLEGRFDPPPDFKPYPLPLSKESIAGFVGITGEVLNIDDVYHLPKTVPYNFNSDLDVRNNYITRSMLVVPMKHQGGEILGVLQLINAMDKTGAIVPFEESIEHLVMSLASQAAVAIRNAKLIADIKALFAALIKYSVSAIDARSPQTAGHSKRVADLCEAIARAISDKTSGPFEEVSFTPEQMEEVIYAAWLHDVGKIGVPEHILDKGNKLSDDTVATIETRFELIKALTAIRIMKHRSAANISETQSHSINEQVKKAERKIEEDLNFIKRVNRSPLLSDEDAASLKAIAYKTYEDLDGNIKSYLTDEELKSLSVKKGNLTEKEYLKIQTHVEHTYNIVKSVPFTKSLSNVPLFAASHHEFLDGTGYPRGLKSDELPLQSRILAIADIFDALTAVDRPYRSAVSPSKACEILNAHAKAGRVDEDIVSLFIEKELYK